MKTDFRNISQAYLPFYKATYSGVNLARKALNVEQLVTESFLRSSVRVDHEKHKKKVLKNLTSENPFSTISKMTDMSLKLKFFDHKIMIVFHKSLGHWI